MNPLEEIHKRIDESDWDIRQSDLINKAYQETGQKLGESSNEILLKKSEIERQAFAFSKSPEKGLSFKIAGTKTMEDGNEVPFQWPDIKEWVEDDFEHIRSRFRSCKSIFALTEFGLVLYYSSHLKDNREVQRLLQGLFDLSKAYLKKSLINNDKGHYILYLRLALANAFEIANNRKNDTDIQIIYKELILFTTEVHNNWNIKHQNTLRSVIDLTDFSIEFKKEFEKYVDLKKYLDQNYKAAIEVSKTYNWGAIYICDVSQKLADVIEDKKYDWQTLKAEQFEAMIQPNIETGNIAAVSFVENALRIYKKTKNTKKIDELSKKYDEARRIFRLGEIRQELPKEESERITEIIKSEVETKNSKEILQTICIRPMYAPVDRIEKMASEIYSENSISKLFPSSIIDKHGNTVEVFNSEEEKKKFEFWQTYSLNFQIGTQTLSQYFFEAYKAGKISFESTVDFLIPTWLGGKYRLLFNGYEFEVRPLDSIIPGLKLFFDELERLKVDNTYNANFIASTDSLVTKIEYLVRFFCREAGIPTFVDKIKNDHKVKNEKNIDELLRALENMEDNPTGFLEDHRKFIEYVMTNKMGNNLRHRVAHGLMDPQEYTVTNLILILNIILILSTYKFNQLEK